MRLPFTSPRRLGPLLFTIGALLTAPGAASADPAQTGRWSAVQEYPVVPISAAVTTDGKIVAWDQADPDLPHSLAPNNGRAMILDPATGAIARSANLSPASVFCPLITTLPDGKVVISGGGNDTTDSDLVQIYDPETRTFGAWSSMSVGRWYGGGNITKDGDVVTLGGRGGSGADVIDAATGRSRRLDVPFGADWYPMALRMPDGRFTIENVTDLQTSASPTRQILDVAGAGSLTGADDLTLLQRRLRMTATMVGPYTMLGITGGTSKDAYLLDVSTDGRPVPRPTGATKDPHITGTAVTLPDGSALVVGGNASGSETLGTPVYGTERWSPQTGQWTSMENSPRQRQYHSVAALLPDGRVWSAGTSINGSGVNEYNGAYFSPPYLFKQDGSGERAPRPQITGSPASASWGERMTFRSPQAASIRRASLVRLSATTHQYDFAGTYVPLDVEIAGDEVAVDVPANGNTVPAGSYMAFLIDSAGVPSKAAIVRIDPAADSTPNATAMMSSQDDPASPAWKGYDEDASAPGPRTKLEDEPWWQLDLGRSRELSGVTVRAAAGAPADALRSAWVFTSDEPLTSTSVAGTLAQEGVTARQLPATPGAAETVALDRTARYIRVQLPGAGRLQFAEVEPAFGSAPSAQLVLTRTSQTDTEVVTRVRNTGAGAATIASVALPGAGWAQAAGPSAPFTVAPGAEATLTLTRGTEDGDLVLRPSRGASVRLALEATPAPDAPPPSTVPSPAAGGWQHNGAAALAGGALRLTPAEAERKGSAFWPTPLDTTGRLTIAFDATLAGGTGADGLAMILADPEQGATPTSLGAGGGALGFGGIPGVAVGLSAYLQSQVGISDGAQPGMWQTLRWLGIASLPAPLQDSTRRVEVTVEDGTLTVTVDGVTVSRAVTLPDRVLLGFSAATGLLTNRHEIRDLVVTGGEVDTTAPDAPAITSGPASPTRETTARIAFTGAEPDGTFTCRLDTGTWQPCTSPRDLTGLADGAHTFAVRHTDTAGNTSTATTHTWTIDTAPPQTTITGGPTGTVAQQTADLTFTADQAGSTFACRLDTGTWEPCTSPGALTGLADGTHTFAVRATDPAGNTDPTPATRTWTVDATAPDAPAISSGPASPTRETTAHLTFTSAEPGGTFTCRLDTGTWQPCTSPRDLTTLTDGPHTFSVRHTDTAGNTSTATTHTWTIDTTPPPAPEPPPTPTTPEPPPTPTTPAPPTTPTTTTPTVPPASEPPTTKPKPNRNPWQRLLARLRGAFWFTPPKSDTTDADLGRKAPGINLRTNRISMGMVTATEPIRVEVRYTARLVRRAGTKRSVTTVLGRRTLKLKPGQTSSLSVPLSPSLRTWLAARKRVRVKTVVRVTGAAGRPSSVTRSVVLAVVAKKPRRR